MKKLVLFAAALVSLVACNKEEAVKNEEAVSADSFVKGQEVTLTVLGPSTTKVTSTKDADSVYFQWQAGDKIKVTVGEGTEAQSAEFTLTSGAGTVSATFSGTMPESGDEFSVQYPVETPDITTQVYSSTEEIPHDEMLFTASGCKVSTPFKLTGQNAVLGLNLWGTGVTISKIVVTNTTSSATYTLNISGGKVLSTSSASPTPFFVVVPAGDWNFSADVYNNEATPATICTLTKTSTDRYFTTAQVLNMPVKEISGLPVLLPGKFSVNAAGKKIQFTRGNLYYSSTDKKYHIEPQQNVTYATLGGKAAYDASHVYTFFWSSIEKCEVSEKQPWAKGYGCTSADESTSDKFFCGSENSMTVDGQSGLYALTGGDSGEWEYLINSRSNASSLYKYGVTVTTAVGAVENCLVIAPDDWDYTNNPLKTSYTADEWATAESAGLVCLPAAGYRYYSNDNNQYSSTSGWYWLATPSSTNNRYAKRFYFTSNSLVSDEYYRYYAYSIRLVHDAEKMAYETVDLGLSVNWATYNIGATKPEEYGAYFAYGDVAGQIWNGSSWSGGGFSSSPSYEVDSNNNLKPAYDAAVQNCRGSWRMPTEAEFKELIDNCTFTWTSSYNGTGVVGYIVTSNKENYTDKSIFIPAAGRSNGKQFLYYGSIGQYWSSSLYTSNINFAFYLYFQNNNYYRTSQQDRYHGLPIRPVSPRN